MTGGVTQAAVNYLQTPGFQQGQTNQYIVSGAVNVDFSKYGLQTPWASSGIQAVFGAEYRKEQTDLVHDAEFLTGDLAGQGTPFGVPDVHGEYDVKEFFTEVSIPLVTGKPGIETLGLSSAYRYSDYSIQGTTNTYKVQLEYAPIKQVRFRAGYNRAVRAPNTLELFNQPNVVLFAGSDPCAGTAPSATAAECARSGVTAAEYGLIDANPASQYNQQTSGRTTLTPEKSDTFTGGVVLNPLHNLSLTIDYYNIKIKNEIGTIGANFILNQCVTNNLFCANVQRAPGGSLFTGTGFVANPTLNLGAVQTSGIDLSANYKLDVGHSSIAFDLIGTYLNEYKVTPLAGGSSYNCEGQFGLTCGTPLPQWRHKLRATFQAPNGLGFSAAWRFFSGVTNDQGLGDNVNPAVRRIPDVSYFDLSLSARIQSKYTLRIGAQNLFDRTPPVLDSNYSNNGSNTYAQVYDSLGRYVYAAITLAF